MKATDLKYPFTWEERHPVLHERVLFVPRHYENHDVWPFPRWDSPSLFGKTGPVFVEYCSGNGEWILEKARVEPHLFWVAVEKRFDRVRKIWLKMQKQKLTNLLVVCGDALTFTKHYLPPCSIEGIYVNFPDPWPKPRHARNRIFQEPFIKEISRVVKKGGGATLVTDDPPYSLQMIEQMQIGDLWRSSFEAPYFKTDWPSYGSSFFDALWRKKGKVIHYHQFINQKGVC